MKQTGQAHRKHFPPRAERAHRTILNLARSSHESSKLPIKFFSDAHRYAVYSYNRLIHNSSIGMSPYQIIHKKIPSLDNCQSFGAICFAYVPKANRSLGKLDNTSVKCRFLGYGDDDSLLEQRQGYKLLRESDQKIFYSTDVLFKEDEEITHLPRIISQDYDAFF